MSRQCDGFEGFVTFWYESHFILFSNLYLAERCPFSIENRPTVWGKQIQELTRFSFQKPNPSEFEWVKKIDVDGRGKYKWRLKVCLKMLAYRTSRQISKIFV